MLTIKSNGWNDAVEGVVNIAEVMVNPPRDSIRLCENEVERLREEVDRLKAVVASMLVHSDLNHVKAVADDLYLQVTCK